MKPIIRFGVILLVIVLGFYTVDIDQGVDIESLGETKAAQITNTRRILQQLQFELSCDFVEDLKFDQSGKDLKTMHDDVWTSIIVHEELGEAVRRICRGNVNSRGFPVDVWGNEYRIKLNQFDYDPGNGVMIYSVGMDGKDDGGLGDDVSMSFYCGSSSSLLEAR